MNSTMWWAYRHSNGTIQLKRWFGDHKDYTDDCENNPFVKQVLAPFEAPNRDAALLQARIALQNGAVPLSTLLQEHKIDEQAGYHLSEQAASQPLLDQLLPQTITEMEMKP